MPIQYFLGEGAKESAEDAELCYIHEDGSFSDSILPLLRKAFPAICPVWNNHNDTPELYRQRLLDFYQTVITQYHFIYFPVEESYAVDIYRDNCGSYGYNNQKSNTIEVPFYEIKSYFENVYPSILNIESFTQKVIESSDNNIYFENLYYGNSVNYQYICLAKDACLTKYLI